MENQIRKLAQSAYWQNLYANIKELHSLSLFKNRKNISKIQILFLHWLSVYNSLYHDLAMEDDYISEEVIKDTIRTDAYLLWRRTVKNKIKKKEESDTDNALGIPKVEFKSKKQEVKNNGR